MLVANRIREIRLAAGMTAEELARAVGTSQQQIGRLETEQRRLTADWMARIGQALGVPPADLLGSGSEVRAVNPDIAPAEGREIAAIAASLAKRGMKVYRVVGDSVSESHAVGSIVTVDETEDGRARLRSGNVVVVASGPDRIRILRHYIAPRLLVTNRRGMNSLDALDNPTTTLEIVGVVIN